MAKIAQLTLMSCLIAALGLITGCETGPVEGAAGADIGVARHLVVNGFSSNPEFALTSDYRGARRTEVYTHESGLFELELISSASSLTTVTMIVHTLDTGSGMGAADVDAEVLTTLPRRFIRNTFNNTERVYDLYSSVAFGPAGAERRIIFEGKDMLFTKDAAGLVTMRVKKSRYVGAE